MRLAEVARLVAERRPGEATAARVAAAVPDSAKATHKITQQNPTSLKPEVVVFGSPPGAREAAALRGAATALLQPAAVVLADLGPEAPHLGEEFRRARLLLRPRLCVLFVLLMMFVLICI